MAGLKSLLRIKLLVRARGSVISRKGYGYRKMPLAGSFMFLAFHARMETQEKESNKGVVASVIITGVVVLILMGIVANSSSNMPQNPPIVASTTDQTAPPIAPADAAPVASNPTNQNTLSPSAPASAKSLPDIVAEWQKSTAYVECYWTYSNSTKWYLKESGSGLLVMFNSTPTIITNRHIANNAQYGMADECDMAFPNDKYVYYSIDTLDSPAHTDYSIPSSPVYLSDIPAHGQIQFTADGSDVAYLSGMKEENMDGAASPTISLQDRARSDHFACFNNPPTGESIAVLGYPDYGTNAGEFMSVFSTINPTVTEGIISGQDGNYLTTSAKIDPGNSGGLAIDETNDCYVGIPTAIEIGQAGTLGRILPASYAAH